MFQKLSGIRLFFARRRRKQVGERISREINWRLFPHILGEKDCGYPFNSEAEFKRALAKAESEMHQTLETIKRQAAHMGKSYGEGFRYLMYCDLNNRLGMYAQAAKRQVQPDSCDPRYVAVHA